MPRPPDPARRAALLDAAADYLLDNGLADMSLRPLAVALDTSPRMLLYHFGSKEQLIADALAATRERQRQASLAWLQQQPDLAPGELLRRFWTWQLDSHQPFLRLFFEVYGLALQGPESYPGFLQRAVADWLDFIQPLLRNAGLTKSQARIAATAAIACYRGLLLDVLATNDRVRTKRALDVALSALEASYSA